MGNLEVPEKGGTGGGPNPRFPKKTTKGSLTVEKEWRFELAVSGIQGGIKGAV